MLNDYLGKSVNSQPNQTLFLSFSHHLSIVCNILLAHRKPPLFVFGYHAVRINFLYEAS